MDFPDNQDVILSAQSSKDWIVEIGNTTTRPPSESPVTAIRDALLTKVREDDVISDSEEEETQDLLIKPEELRTILKKTSVSTTLLKAKETDVLPSSLKKAISEARREAEEAKSQRAISNLNRSKRSSRRTHDAYQRHPYIGDAVTNTYHCTREYASELIEQSEDILVKKFQQGYQVLINFLIELRDKVYTESDDDLHEESQNRTTEHSNKKPKKKKKITKPTRVHDSLLGDIPIPIDNTEEDQDYDIETNHISDDDADEEVYGLEEEPVSSTRRRKKPIIRVDDESQERRVPLGSIDESQGLFMFRGQVLKKKSLAKKAGLPQSHFTLQEKKASSSSNSLPMKRILAGGDGRGFAKKKKKSSSDTLATPKVSLDSDFITDEIIEDANIVPFNFDRPLTVTHGGHFQVFNAIEKKYENDNAQEDQEDFQEDIYVDEYNYFESEEESEDDDASPRDFIVTDPKPSHEFPTYQAVEDGRQLPKERKQYRIDELIPKPNEPVCNDIYNFDNVISNFNRSGEAYEVLENVDSLLSRGFSGTSGTPLRSSNGTQRKQGTGTKRANDSPAIAARKYTRSQLKPHEPSSIRSKKSQVLKLYVPGLENESEIAQKLSGITPKRESKSIKAEKKSKQKSVIKHVSNNMKLVTHNYQQTLVAEELSNEVVYIPIKSRSSKPLVSIHLPIFEGTQLEHETFKESQIFKYLKTGKSVEFKSEYILSIPKSDIKIIFSKRSLSFDANFDLFTESLIVNAIPEALKTHRTNFALFQEFLVTFLNSENARTLEGKLQTLIKQLDRPNTKTLYAWYLSQILLCYRIISKYYQRENTSFDEDFYVKKVLILIFRDFLGPKSSKAANELEHYMLKDTLDICFNTDERSSMFVIYNKVIVKNIPVWLYIWDGYVNKRFEANWEFIQKMVKSLDKVNLKKTFNWISSLDSAFPEEVILEMYKKLASLKFETDLENNKKTMILKSSGDDLDPVSAVNIYINCFKNSEIKSSRVKESLRPTSNASTEDEILIIDRVNIYLALALKFGDNHDERINKLIGSLTLLRSLEIIITLIQINEKNGNPTKISSLEEIIKKIIRFGKLQLWTKFLDLLEVDRLNLKTFEYLADCIFCHISNQSFIKASKPAIEKYLVRLDPVSSRHRIIKLQFDHTSLLFNEPGLWAKISKMLVASKIKSWDALLQGVDYNDNCSEGQKLVVYQSILKEADDVFDKHPVYFLGILIRNLMNFQGSLTEPLNSFYTQIHKRFNSSLDYINHKNSWSILRSLIEYITSLKTISYRVQIMSMLITSLSSLSKSPEARNLLELSQVVKEINKYQDRLGSNLKSSPVFQELLLSLNMVRVNIRDDITCLEVVVMELLQSGFTLGCERKLELHQSFVRSQRIGSSLFETLELLMRVLLTLSQNYDEAWVYLIELGALFKECVQYNSQNKNTFQILKIIKLSEFVLICENDGLRFDFLTSIYKVLKIMYYCLGDLKEFYVFEMIFQPFQNDHKILQRFDVSIDGIKCTDPILLQRIQVFLQSRRLAGSCERSEEKRETVLQLIEESELLMSF